MEDGNSFVGVPVMVNSMGDATGTAIITVNSLVNMAMNNHFYSPSSAISGGLSTTVSAYTGVLFGAPDNETGKYAPTKVNYYLKQLIANASDQARSDWMEKIEFDYTGVQSDKLVESMPWNGDTISTLFFNILGSAFDVTVEINGTKVIVRNTDKDRPDRSFTDTDIFNINYGFDLNASSAQVFIESPDVNSYTSPTAVTLPSANRFYGLPQKLSNSFGSNTFDVGTGSLPDNSRFNVQRSAFEYENPHSAGTFKLNVDTRYTVKTSKTGEAYDKYNWKKRTVIIDEELGRAGASSKTHLDTTFDRTAEQNNIASYYARVLGDIEYQGSMVVAYDTAVRVGDVIRLPDNKRVIVKQIRYAMNSPRKLISFGNNEGNAYDEIKSRTRLGEYKAKEAKVSNERLFLVKSPWGDLKYMTWAQWRNTQTGLGVGATEWHLIMEGAGVKTANSNKSRSRSKARQHREDKRAARRDELAKKKTQRQANKDVDYITDNNDGFSPTPDLNAGAGDIGRPEMKPAIAAGAGPVSDADNNIIEKFKSAKPKDTREKEE